MCTVDGAVAANAAVTAALPSQPDPARVPSSPPPHEGTTAFSRGCPAISSARSETSLKTKDGYALQGAEGGSEDSSRRQGGLDSDGPTGMENWHRSGRLAQVWSRGAQAKGFGRHAHNAARPATSGLH